MKYHAVFLLILMPVLLFAQHGLEDIIVELYYVSDSNDSTDILSGQHLKPGTKTYRIYVDMAPGYKMQLVYGESGHPLRLASTKRFFNNIRGGYGQGDYISTVKLKEGTVGLDSWLTLGAVSQKHQGVLKNLDDDGSIIGGENNDGGSSRLPSGLLTDNLPAAGVPITIADGYRESEVPDVIFFNIALDLFVKKENTGILDTDNGAWGAIKGAQGLTEENQVIIAQVTTEGDLSFELNLQLLAPYGGVERFMARNPNDSDFLHPALIYPKPAAP